MIGSPCRNKSTSWNRGRREASDLPPVSTDLRLSVSPSGGSTDSDSQTVETGERLSVTDVVFQNPTGAVGTVSLLLTETCCWHPSSANFRDYDLHLVAPYVFDESSEITLEVDCRTPGPGEAECPVAASILGFVDQVDWTGPRRIEGSASEGVTDAVPERCALPKPVPPTGHQQLRRDVAEEIRSTGER